MEIGVWMLPAWGSVVAAMLVLLKVWLGRICDFSCEDLTCLSETVCEHSRR